MQQSKIMKTQSIITLPKITKHVVMTFINSDIDKIPERTTKNHYKYVKGAERKQKAPYGKYKQLNELRRVIQDVKDTFK